MLNKKEKLVKELLKSVRVLQRKIKSFESEKDLAIELDLRRIECSLALLTEDAESYLEHPVLDTVNHAGESSM